VLVSAARSEEAHYETHAAADPRDPGKLLATAIVYPKKGRRGTVVYASSDGGKTWTVSFQGDVLENTGDPAVGYGPDGTGFFAVLTSRGHPLEKIPEHPSHAWDGRKTLLYRLPPGASSWQGPATFLFADREYIAVDDTKGKFNGRVYVSGDPRPGSGFVVFASTDGGATFPQVQGAESDNRGTTLSNLALTSAGTILGAYADPAGHVRVARSTDGGKTFLPSAVVDTFVRAGNRKDPKHNNVNHFMTLAVDRSGGPYDDRVYLAWPDRRSGHSQVFLAHSSDDGQTWSTSRVPTDNAPADTTDQFMPTLAVNRDGVAGLLFYDRRDNPDNRAFYARFTASIDGGVTWLPSVRLSGSEYAAGEVAKKSAFTYNGGDTAGLAVSADGLFHPVWVADRAGIPQVYTSTVTVEGKTR
jgi:photosystem II stability/assembly factor-like uncharacterized protein